MKFCLLMILIPTFALAHGEDKPGPHGGHIRMPGAFHTELVAQKDKISIYLLDMEWKNPKIQDSKVSLQVDNKTLDCTPNDATKGFDCQVPAKALAKKFKGTIKVNASRENAIGSEAIYKFPLSFEKTSTMDHSKHMGH